MSGPAQLGLQELEMNVPEPNVLGLNLLGLNTGHSLRSADFQRVLSQFPRSRSAHFAAHHVAARPLAPAKGGNKAALTATCTELSTGDELSCTPPVDDSTLGWWLGTVVPKRNARRSVTRNLIKRQMREAMAAAVRQAGSTRGMALGGRPLTSLPRGIWVLRLKSPFDVKQYPSAASAALRQAAGEEIAQLLIRAAAASPPVEAARPRRARVGPGSPQA